MNLDKQLNQLINQKLEHVLTEMGELPFKEVEFITTGCEKDVLILDKKTVIAFYRGGLHIDRYRVRQELTRRLSKQTEVVFPECLYISQTQKFVMETYVPGYKITPQYVEINLGNAQQLGRSVGSFLKQLHRISDQKLDLLTDFIQDVQNDMVEGLKILRLKLTQSEIEQVKRFLNVFYQITTSVQRCIVHGDFHFDNILWDESASRLGIIDFSEAGKEDPALDFMYMCRFPEVETLLETFRIEGINAISAV